jgi:UDP-N-acetylglucosamine--dolichyl-phosphate N-acetylglucosaminephosphotransferase
MSLSPVFAVLAALVGLSFSLASMPYLMKTLRKKGFIARDMYKKGNVLVPTNGGLIVLFGCFFILIVFPVFMYGLWLVNIYWSKALWMMKEPMALTPLVQMGVLVVAIYGLYGLLDDYLKLDAILKIIIPLFFTVPLVEPLYYITVQVPVLGPIDNRVLLGLPGWDLKFVNLYRYLIVPIYVMVVANLFNMHSGFNGLQSGLSVIVLFFILLKAVSLGKSEDILGLTAILGICGGFWWYNKYPSEIFSGNVGSYVMGAAIGVAIITTGVLIAGFVMLLPHIFNFLLYAYSKLRRIKIKKFGRVKADGTLEVPSNLTLKYIIPYYLRVTEKDAVYILYGITAVFCIIGFLVPF